jgi:DNA-binding NarL/FixJ family response regulator
VSGKSRTSQAKNSLPAGGPEPVRVLVVAPALAVRTGLRALLSTDQEIEVVGEAAVLSGFDHQLSGIDVLVVAAGSGYLSDLQSVLTDSVTAGILLLVGDPLPVDWEQPQLHGRAWGLLPLDSSVEDLRAAVHAISAGLIVGSPALIEPLLVSRRPALNEDSEPLIEPLTDREIEVLQLLSQGLANKQIAATLGISEHTVKFHVSGIYAKLGAASRTEAVRLGVRRGLVIL